VIFTAGSGRKKGKGDRSFGRPDLTPRRAWRNIVGVEVERRGDREASDPVAHHPPAASTSESTC